MIREVSLGTIDEERVPVVVAVAQAVEKAAPVSALGLLERAGREALDQVPLIGPVDRVSVVGILSPSGASPASQLSERLGIRPRVVETTTVGGNSPQWLITRAADDIAAGRIATTLIGGAEAFHSVRRGGAPGATGEDLEPDPVVGDPRPGVGAAETAVGVVVPVHLYALFESAIAHRAGRSPVEHRAALGTLMAPFTAVASANPFAWFREERTAADIAEVSAANRLVSEPYTKMMCAFINVDQAAVLVVTSLAAARRAGAADRAVFVWSGADASDVWFPVARPDLGSSPGIAAAAGSALAAGGTGVDEVELMDLYSCFPCAVEMACDAIGVRGDDPRGLTVTGGLAAFGGPGNNYTAHAIASMVEKLRGSGATGLVGGLGWYVTKHSYGLYGGRPPVGGYRRGDTAAEQSRIDASALPVVEGPFEGPASASVEAATVTYDGSGANGAPVIARLSDGSRVVAAAHRSEIDGLSGRSIVGSRIRVDGWPPRYRVED